MLKQTVVRLLLFGIPFGLSYWATQAGPAASPSTNLDGVLPTPATALVNCGSAWILRAVPTIRGKGPFGPSGREERSDSFPNSNGGKLSIPF